MSVIGSMAEEHEILVYKRPKQNCKAKYYSTKRESQIFKYFNQTISRNNTHIMKQSYSCFDFKELSMKLQPVVTGMSTLDINTCTETPCRSSATAGIYTEPNNLPHNTQIGDDVIKKLNSKRSLSVHVINKADANNNNITSCKQLQKFSSMPNLLNGVSVLSKLSDPLMKHSTGKILAHGNSTEGNSVADECLVDDLKTSSTEVKQKRYKRIYKLVENLFTFKRKPS